MLWPLLLCAVAHAQTAPAPVAGLRPDQRPEQAPRVAEQPMPAEQVTRALLGVSQPHPGNVAVIASTGQWFVPLRHPGMTGPYDIRGWHSAKPAPATEPKKP